MAPVVEAYRAMRGVSFLVAATFAAEIGDVRRFDTPRPLMSFLGLAYRIRAGRWLASPLGAG
jgi:transposase